MWDTVRAEKRCELDPGRLLGAGFSQHVDRKVDVSTGEVKEVVAYDLHLPGQSPHYLAYLPPLHSDASDPAGHLKVETSLPKAVRGENVTLLCDDDIRSALDIVSDRVCEKVGDVGDFANFDLRGRVDAVFSWRTHHVGDYLHALKGMNLGRHVSQSIDRDATVYWRNQQRVIRSYDKFNESHLDIAKNQLRFEIQLNHAKSELTRLAGINSTKLVDVLTWKNSRAVIQFYLSQLGADLMIADDEKLVQHLLRVCGPTKAKRLLGALMMQRAYSRDELIRRGMSRRSFYYDRAEIRSVGLSEGSAKTGVLPPLQLPDHFTGEPLKLD